MEVFTQQTRDALYGRYFLYAVQGKQPDLLRIINFTPTGVIFGRVPMIVSQHDDDSFASTANYSADLLPVPGCKPIQVTRDGPTDRYVYNNTKTGKRYTKRYTMWEPTPNVAWPWSTEKPKPKSRKSTGGSKRKAPSASKKTKHADDADEQEQADDAEQDEQEPDDAAQEEVPSEPEEEVVVRKVSKPKPALKQTQSHAQPAKPAVQKKPQLPVTNVSLKQPTPIRPVSKVLTPPPSKLIRSPKRAETMDQIIDSSVPEIGEFLNDLRDGDD